MSQTLKDAVFTVLEGFTLPHEVRKILEKAYYNDSTAKQETESDPCPCCRKGIVCRTPDCGRLKLPVDHYYRTAQVKTEIGFAKFPLPKEESTV